MTRPRKIQPQAGFEPRIFRSRGGRLNHLTNDAVGGGEERQTDIDRATERVPLRYGMENGNACNNHSNNNYYYCVKLVVIMVIMYSDNMSH